MNLWFTSNPSPQNGEGLEVKLLSSLPFPEIHHSQVLWDSVIPADLKAQIQKASDGLKHGYIKIGLQ